MGIEKSNVLRNISLCVWDIFLLQTDSFYGFRPKTVRFWDGERKRKIVGSRL